MQSKARGVLVGTVVVRPNNGQQCKFFLSGTCWKGSACRFSHEQFGGANRFGCNLTSSSSSHAGARLASTRDPDMRQSNTIDELVQLAYDHLDTISPQGMAAFWSLLVKHVQNHRGNSRVQLNEQLVSLLDSTMESMYKFDGRDIATVAINLVKIMKQVESRGQRADTGSLHRIHNLLVGINSENKHYIFSEIAMHAIPILYTFDARSLSNLINSFGHAEYVPKVEDGRTILDILALEAMSKLKHFNSQDLSNMLWSYAKMESSNSVLFKAAGDLIVVMNDLSEFKPQELSNIVWSYATARESHPQLCRKFADHIVAMKDLGQFKPQVLSNIVWSYATARETHPKLFSKFADHIVALDDVGQFKPQELSNIIWAYATSGEAHPRLFSKVSDHIVAMKDLRHFKPQDFSNIIWSYTTAGHTHQQLYEKLANHIVAMKDLSVFKSQHFSNILWSYATAGESHPKLYSKFGDHILAIKDLSAFLPQHFSNIVWSYATAGEPHPKLYKKLANHIASLDNLNRFNPQAFSNILWAYATSGESNPKLFDKFGDHIVAMKDLGLFKPQELSNIVWAFATSGESHPLLFQKLAVVVIARSKDFNSQGPAVKSVLIQCSSQALANIAWAYAVANINDPLLFNTDFVDVCQAKANDFGMEGYFQLHQWQLWQDEIKSGINLPPALREKCRQAFISRLPEPSRFQHDVIFELSSIGMSPKEEVLTPSGYRLDALVEVNGVKVGIEVDGPSHFINQQPTGSTLLKRRQVNNLDDIRIESVPYWEWNKLGRDSAKKQEYLCSKLDVSSHRELSISNADARHAMSTKHLQLLQGRWQAPASSGSAAWRSEWQTGQQQGERGRGEVRYPNYDGGHASNPAVLTDINYVNRKHLRPSDHSCDQARKRFRRV